MRYCFNKDAYFNVSNMYVLSAGKFGFFQKPNPLKRCGELNEYLQEVVSRSNYNKLSKDSQDWLEAFLYVDQHCSGAAGGAPLAAEPHHTPAYLAAREQLVEIYSRHNPEKLGEIDGMLKKNAGMEDALVSAVLDKYISQPAPTHISPAPSPAPPAPAPASAAAPMAKMTAEERRIHDLRKKKLVCSHAITTSMAMFIIASMQIYDDRW